MTVGYKIRHIPTGSFLSKYVNGYTHRWTLGPKGKTWSNKLNYLLDNYVTYGNRLPDKIRYKLKVGYDDEYVIKKEDLEWVELTDKKEIISPLTTKILELNGFKHYESTWFTKGLAIEEKIIGSGSYFYLDTMKADIRLKTVEQLKQLMILAGLEEQANKLKTN